VDTVERLADTPLEELVVCNIKRGSQRLSVCCP
jgi:hypothetical protein